MATIANSVASLKSELTNTTTAKQKTVDCGWRDVSYRQGEKSGKQNGRWIAWIRKEGETTGGISPSFILEILNLSSEQLAQLRVLCEKAVAKRDSDNQAKFGTKVERLDDSLVYVAMLKQAAQHTETGSRAMRVELVIDSIPTDTQNPYLKMLVVCKSIADDAARWQRINLVLETLLAN
jgi:hypothetical protein